MGQRAGGELVMEEGSCAKVERTHLDSQNLASVWIPGGGGGRCFALVNGCH